MYVVKKNFSIYIRKPSFPIKKKKKRTMYIYISWRPDQRPVMTVFVGCLRGKIMKEKSFANNAYAEIDYISHQWGLLQ